MKRGSTGRYEVTTVGGETVRAFVPRPLPPEPPLDLHGPIQPLLERALLAVGRLDSVSTLLPGTGLFLYAYVRKEAVLSSQIEGTQSSLSDLLLFEMEQAPGVPALEARTQLGQIMKEVQSGQVRVLVEKSGVPMVGIISAEEFRRVIAEREARFEVVDRIRRRLPSASDAEIQRDVGAALKQVRRRRRRA